MTLEGLPVLLYHQLPALVEKEIRNISDTAGMQAAKAAATAVRSFQPALREITQVSSELRSNISGELGLDELQREFDDIRRTTRESMSINAVQPRSTSTQQGSASSTNARNEGGATSSTASSSGSSRANGAAAAAGDGANQRGAGANGASSTTSMDDSERRALTEISAGLSEMDELQASKSRSDLVHRGVDAIEESAEELQHKREASARMAWGGGDMGQSLDSTETGAAALKAVQDGSSEFKRLEDMTLAELEAELAKRRLLKKKIEELEV